MKYLRIICSALLLFLFADVQAQKKKVTTKSKVNTVTLRTITRNFGAPTSVSQIADVTEADVAYESLKNLIENYNVTLTYDDNTFKGKELLNRGDFIVALNSALVNLKNRMNAAGLDTSLINTYDRNRGGAYLTSIAQIKDINESNIYYPAARSLIEQWGIGEPFSLGKTLNANSTVSEKEVYDILRVVLGYNSAGVNPYSSAISRNKFAIVLNNAVTQKLTEIKTLASIQQARKDAERRRQLDSLQRVDMFRRDSVAKEIEARKQEAAKKEEEARQQLLKKKK